MKHFYSSLFLLLVCFGAKSQISIKIKELNRGRLQIAGLNYGHPYTMFDKHNGKSFEETIESIRGRIIIEKDTSINSIFKSYEQIYNNTQNPMPSDNGMPDNTISALALWAKNNAFVMLVGLDAAGNELTLGKRDTFKLNVLKAFDAL